MEEAEKDISVLLIYEVSDEACLLLDTVKEGITDSTGVSLLLDVKLKDAADGAMIKVSDNVTLVDVTNNVDVSSRFDAALVELNVTEGVKVCSLLDTALIEVTGNVEEGLLLDSTLVIIMVGAAAAVEIEEFFSNLLLNILTDLVIREIAVVAE